MKKWFTLKWLLFVLVSSASISGWSQITAWNTNSLTGATSGSINATTTNANLLTPVLSRGAGIVAASLSSGYSSNNWVDVSEATAITNNRYYQCTISANTSYIVSLSTLDSRLRRTSSGPDTYIWRFSTDGTNFTDIGSSVSFSTTGSTGDAQSQISLSGITGLQNVASGTTITLRLYAWRVATGGASAGTLAFGTTNANSLALGGTVASNASAPSFTVPITSLTGFTTTVGTASSPAQTFTMLGSNLTNSVTVTPPTSPILYEVSSDGTTYSPSLTLTPTSGSLSATIYVRISGSSSASTSTTENLIVASTAIPTPDFTSQTVALTGSVNANGATLTTNFALPSFGNICINTVAGPNSFKIDGYNLDGSNISIAALSGFAYSEVSTGPFTNTLSFSYAGTSLIAKQIYVQFTPTAIQSYSGNIVLSGGGLITNYSIPDTGSGVNSGPTVTTATSAISVSATTATIGGTINSSGCSPVTAYGIEYSANSGFAAGTGTQMASSNLSAGNFSATISGLSPNTRYYYFAYAISGGTTTYGLQQGFNAAPLPVLMSSQPNLSYTQSFDDIATWSNYFTTGNGANHFNGLSAVTVGAIPDGKTITASTNSFQGATYGASGGVQRGTDQVPSTQSIVLLSTGSPDNTTSAAIDFYMDFTGLNAGTLSFDYQTLNNSTGNRNGSLRVYYTTDGVTFIDSVKADVISFTNNVPISGSKTNIVLPAAFNNSPTARIRFYYYNGEGNTGTGSRPKISIDNLTITAVATTPCTSPTAPATNLAFGAITDTTIAGSFTAASPTSDNYIVVASTNSSLTKNPDNGQIYNLGDNLGDGTVVAKGTSTSFVASGLSASTLYYFFVFPVNSVCTGGPLYYSTTILTGQTSTVAGLPTCAAPASQPTAYTAGTTGTNTLSGSFTATTADEYLVLASTASTFSGALTNGQLYSNGDVVGNATVVKRSNTTSFTAAGLAPNTTYYIYVFSSNTQACVNGPAYNAISPLTSGAQTTNPLPPCSTPLAQPTQLTFNASNTAISGAFTPSTSADDYLVVMSANAITPIPTDGTDYNVGDNLGGGTVVANSTASNFMIANLTAGTQYYFYVFSANKNCAGGTKYIAINPLTNNTTTTNVLANNYYFGNIHSHSDYSDGNKDRPGYTPADDYAYAHTAQCMDFLGISEHNHYSGGDPGNTIGNYHLGSTQANTFTANNPGFLAMYGMEWGVISGGGHVVVYGDGMDKLFGWESGSGGWGATDNYDVYVPKSVYTSPTGLFKTVNDNIATNTFATLAHPNQTDYNNIAGSAYDASADSAITGAAVESGPATSTNTTYSNPGSSLSYLPYFQTLLAKGYHLGPTIDHDNHNTTFGHTTYSRTAVVSPALTKTEIVKAYRNMHFYATQDCDSKVDYSINTKQMGSIVTDRYAPIISVTLTDATTNTSSAIIKIMYGMPGSGILAAKIDSVIGNKLTFTDNNLANLATGYYYVDITNGTARIITSPIWYTRNDANSTVVLPITLSSFTAQKTNTSVKLSWTTSQEANSSLFVIERSADGANWTAIGSQAAAGTSTKPLDYNFYDNSPLNGINYYRLKEVDIDGKFTYSDTRSVLFANRLQLSVSPNPAHDFINIYVSNTTNETYHIQLTDTNGKLLKKIDSNEQHLLISTSNFAKGVYFIKYIDNNLVTTKKIIIE